MLCYDIRGLPTTFPDSDMCGHDNRRCDYCYAWFVINKMINVCLEQMSVVRMVLQRRSSEEVYNGRFVGYFL